MINKIKNRLRREKYKFQERKEEKHVHEVLKDNQKPIYHIHIRKAAGTTINFAFLSNANVDDVEEFYDSMSDKRNHRVIENNKVFVGWNKRLINEGNYSFAFSHIPLHQLNLPANTFTFSCLRDPVKRVISHYNMLRYYQLNESNHPTLRKEGMWLGNSFDDFLTMIPTEHLLNQLYMFSKDFNINESFEKLLSIDKIIYAEDLKNGLESLEEITGWNLPISNQKKYGFKEVLKDEQLLKLRERLEPEYQMIERLKKEHYSSFKALELIIN